MRRLTKMALAIILTLGLVAPAQAHTLSPTHAGPPHGIQGDGFGWYHSTTQYACDGEVIRFYHRHYTYLAAKHAYVFQHVSNAYRAC